MKRAETLQRKLADPLDAIQACSDIVEGNFRAATDTVDLVEVIARILTDFQILAMGNSGPQVPLTGCDPGDENDYKGAV